MSTNSLASESEPSLQGEIRNELGSMTMEEILKLKDELGAKVYNEAVLGAKPTKKQGLVKEGDNNLKRNNKNRPREMSAKRQVPFLCADLRKHITERSCELRDPRFDARAGEYKSKHFKEAYKFINDIREREIAELRTELKKTTDEEKCIVIKQQIQRLFNKNVEEKKWHAKQAKLKQEKEEFDQALASGQQPHYLTKKERRTKDLVEQFEDLKRSGRLNKHLEKRRKKNATKDRRKIHLD